MRRVRLIPRLDIKGQNLIKGIQLEGLRVLGEPHAFAHRYYEQGADEILYMDAVASLYNRDTMADLVQRTARDIFVPITVGGGLRSIEDVRTMLRAGADKIAINTAATHTPALVSDLARRFGAQCVVLQIDAKRNPRGGWEAYRDGGREHTGLDVVEWAKQGEELGAGEILLTSVDREGTRKGFDIELVKAVCAAVSIPVIASGGMSNYAHMRQVIVEGGADAVAMAWTLHYGLETLPELRKRARTDGIEVRA